MKYTRHLLSSAALLLLPLLVASAGAFGQQAPNVIVPCDSTGQVNYTGWLDYSVPTGQTAVGVASNIIAAEIASEWGCGICGQQQPFWSCNKGATGSADPTDFSGIVYEVGGIWYVYGPYSGDIDVECRPC